MFNVSALLLDDALLKCVVTEVVVFSKFKMAACSVSDFAGSMTLFEVFRTSAEFRVHISSRC